MKKRQSSEFIISLAVLSLTVVLLWIYLSIFQTLKKPPEKPLLTPQETGLFDPKLDQSVFEGLKKRRTNGN